MAIYNLHLVEWIKLFMLALWSYGVKGKTIAFEIYKRPSRHDSNQGLKPHVYRPIPHNFIRLLVLHAGKPGEPLRGELTSNRYVNNDFRKPYEALSYVWGESTRRKSMVLDNQHFAINQNLYEALQHLRSRSSNRTLWIDAICINQANESERNYQVSLMGDIYTCANHVVNWLGPPTSNTVLGLEILAYLFGDEDISSNPPWKKYRASQVRAGLNDILERNYFKRMWVVQENALASKITLQLGSATLTWRSGALTHRAICRIKFAVISPSWEAAGLRDIDVRPLLEILEQSMMVTRRKMDKSCREVTILDQAFDMRYRRATDRRDMIYALRSMVPEEMRDNLVVDYNKSVDELYADFYREVAKAYIKEIEFVRSSERERLDKERDRQLQFRGSRTLGGW
ncbi:heterokaryon incompatibility protein-domain-containing protein [Cadophora sp. MPI-SDFR-AT-0126]|nr:heterokaryon incompatibility protein-domain-containing protein [Leotiomycetes sp. MPI-SDFR-AT-0126]